MSARWRSAAGWCVNHGRRLLPASMVPVVVAARTRLALRRPAVRDDARRQMRFVLGDDATDAQVERLVAAYVERTIWRGESRWHPELVGRQPVAGIEHLRAAVAEGAGVLVNIVHHGDYEGVFPSLAAAGVPNRAVVTSELFDPAAPIWMRQQARTIDRSGVTLLDVAEGSRGIRDVLSRGEVVVMAMDQPGHTTLRFLGHDLRLTSGVARIAIEEGVPVVVASAVPNPAAPRGCAKLVLHPPLRPEEFDSADALLAEIARRHEQAFRAWPEASEHPRRMLDRELVREPSSAGSADSRVVAEGPRRSVSMSGVRAAVARRVNRARLLLPASSVPAQVAVRSRLALRRSSVMADARAQMRFVVGDDTPEEELERLATAYVRQSVWRGESRWHPDLVTHQEIVGLEQLEALRAEGRGVIVNFVHLGDYEGISPSLAWAGVPTHAVATSDMFDPRAPVWMKQQMQCVTSHPDVSLLDVARGSAGIKEALAQGTVVCLATDQPGHTPLRFLGRDLLLSSGAARIAQQTGVPVAVITCHPRREHPYQCGYLKISAVLRPDEFGSTGELLGAMMQHHEQAFLAWPEAAEHPLRMTNDKLVRPSSWHPTGTA